MEVELFVMIRDDWRVWRLVGYDDQCLCLTAPTWVSGIGVRLVLKTLCRVGEAKDWRTSRHAPAWEAGGGEELARGSR